PYTTLFRSHDRVRAVRVDAAEAVDRLLDDLRDLVVDGVVGRNGERLGAGGLDLGDRVVERRGVPRGDDDLRSPLAREARDRPSEAARSARDDDDLLAQRLLPHPVLVSTEGSSQTRYPAVNAEHRNWRDRASA